MKTEKVYQDSEALRKIIKRLKGMKFRLDCGHVVTFGYYLGNDVVFRNGKEPEIVCLDCGR